MTQQNSYSANALIAMVEVNARSMTDEFIRESWNNAFATATRTNDRVWIAIRDIYAAELDRRDAARRYAR